MRFSAIYLALFILSIIVLLMGGFVPILDVDAAQYASISREMSVTGSVLKIYNGGREYLDKPPLLFWLSSALMWLTGSSEFTYKLPSMIFAIWAGWGISRLGKSWFKSTVEIYAAILWFSCQGFFLMNLDVRTDLLLTSCVVLAVWQFDRFLETESIKFGIFAGFFTGLAMLAKGPLGLILTGILTGLNLIVRNKWSLTWKPKTWIWLPVLLIVLLPMSIGLYQQFGSEGLYFYYWKQSFGRITGENEWRNDAGPFFLTQNLLWAALPWTFVFLAAVADFGKKLIQNRLKEDIFSFQFLCFLGVAIPLVVLSRSHYQLPHYIFVVLPFVCLFSAQYLDKIFAKPPEKNENILGLISMIFVTLVILIAIFGEFFILSSGQIGFRLLWLGMIVGAFIYLFRTQQYIFPSFKLFFIPAFVAIWVNLYLNASFYPALMEFQPSKKVANWFIEQDISPKNLFVYKYGASHSLDFYTSKSNYVLYEPKDIVSVRAEFLVTNLEGYHELLAAGTRLKILRVYPEYSVQFLSIPFLNPQTRNQQVRQLLLLQIDS